MTYRCIECWEYFHADTKSTWRKCEGCKAKIIRNKNFDDNFEKSKQNYLRTGRWIIAQGSFGNFGTKTTVDKLK